MQILSATEAIKPAIERTKLVILKPFRLGRSWKFSITAHFSTAGSFFFPLPLIGLFFIPLVMHDGPRWAALAILVGIVLLLAVMIFIFVLCSRLQFPFMDVVMNRSQFIAPLWRRYGPQAHRWTKAKIFIGTASSSLLVIPCVVFLWEFIRNGHSHPIFTDALTNSQPNALPLIAGSSFFFAVLFVYAFLAIGVLVMSVVNDFMLPPLAIEDASISDAWRFVRNLVSTEPGQVALYALLKIILGLIAQMAFVIVFEIVMLIVLMVFGLVGALLSALLHAMGIPSAILTVLGVVLFGLIYIGFLYFMMFAYGIPNIFLEAYKLYFLGGRYAPLGDLLDRSTPPSEPMTPPSNYLAYASPPSNESL